MSTITENLSTTSTFRLTGVGRTGRDSNAEVRTRLVALQRWESEGGAVLDASRAGNDDWGPRRSRDSRPL